MTPLEFAVKQLNSLVQVSPGDDILTQGYREILNRLNSQPAQAQEQQNFQIDIEKLLTELPSGYLVNELGKRLHRYEDQIMALVRREIPNFDEPEYAQQQEFEQAHQPEPAQEQYNGPIEEEPFKIDLTEPHVEISGDTNHCFCGISPQIKESESGWFIVEPSCRNPKCQELMTGQYRVRDNAVIAWNHNLIMANAEPCQE
jgi:hypothetical protein